MITLAEFFDLNREVIFFVYGLVFFALGFAIILQTRRSSRLDLARSLRPFTRCLACNAPLAPIDPYQSSVHALNLHGREGVSLIAAAANLKLQQSSLVATDAADSNSVCLLAGPAGASAEWYGNHLQGQRCDGVQVNLICAGNTLRGTGLLAGSCP